MFWQSWLNFPGVTIAMARILGWLWLIVAMAATNPVAAQVGFDRWGGDYQSFPLRSGDPAQCAARCERDARCRAWAFSYPATESAQAICWLKSRVTARTPAPCCVSGVRGAGVIEPRGGPIEFAIERVGGDYRHFDLPPDHTGKSCQLACEADEGCRAWTYQRPGYVGAAASCHLKDRITRPVRRPCCISGVVR
jgi:PAN domain